MNDCKFDNKTIHINNNNQNPWKTWYNTLKKAPLTPPDYVFGPVWTILYITIAISLFLFYRKDGFKKNSKGTFWFFAQLALNISWSYAFFTLQNPKLAFAIILLLDISIYMTIKEFSKVDVSSSQILYPYFIWVLFATYLNGYIVGAN
jgi:tryptophan-rich sensory protein